MRETLIRQMFSKDLPLVMKIEREVFSDPWQEIMFRQELEAGSAYIMETEDEHQIIGYACGLKILDEYMITNIAIRKEDQHKGYGAKLMLFLLGEIVKQGCKTCYLEVRAANKAAIDFYNRHSFVIIGRRKNYYRDPVEDALVMKLDLHGDKE